MGADHTPPSGLDKVLRSPKCSLLLTRCHHDHAQTQIQARILAAEWPTERLRLVDVTVEREVPAWPLPRGSPRPDPRSDSHCPKEQRKRFLAAQSIPDALATIFNARV